jgi:multicomponent K+:H+ antiporter subunit A
MTHWLLPVVVVLPVLAGAALGAFPHKRRGAAAVIAGAAALLGLGLVGLCTPPILDGEVLAWQVGWLPELGLDAGLRMDGLAWLFTLLILGIGFLVVVYASYYLHASDPAVRFFQFLLLFMGAMLGVVLADNLILLVVFWELTSLTSFLLIGYWHERADARQGARMALIITGAGGLALLGAVLLIGKMVGSYRLDDVLVAGEQLRAHPLYMPALLLLLVGAFTKSAQFPVHFWLPHAMAAPTPVSAYLHSATMVKAGVFLLARLYPAMSGTEPWFWMVSSVGLATLLVGAYLAVFQHDLKGLLAYSTISHLGLITLMLGVDEPLGVVAAVFHIINHATFKASLFMAAGIIDHECGTRDMRRLSGLFRLMPYTAGLAIVASAAMAGVPLLNGFLSKEMFFAETVAKEGHLIMEVMLPVGAATAGALSVAYSTRFIHDVFFGGPARALERIPHEPPRFMRVPVELLVLICLSVGLAPQLTVAAVLATAAQAALGSPLPAYELAIWHGFTLPLLMSGFAFLAGLALYFGLRRFLDLHRTVHFPRGGREAFLNGYARTLEWARRVTLSLETGQLQRYLVLLVITSVFAGALPFASEPAVDSARFEPWDTATSTPLNPIALALWIVGATAALGAAAVHRERLLAIVLVSAVGLTVSLLFAHMSAPDLALTQLLVDLVTMVLMMLALRWLPDKGRSENAPRRKGRDIAVAVLAGGGLAALTWQMLSRSGTSIASYFLENAKTLGGGTNVVNVILVDFRAFDTLGEVTVLAVAALVVYALLSRFTPSTAPKSEENSDGARSLLLSQVARLLLPFSVLVSLYLFLRGHNLPGGGFIAGLVLAVGLTVRHVAEGQDHVNRRTSYQVWLCAGLLLAGLTGSGAWLVQHPFLTSTFTYWNLPLLGPVPLASALLFDLGIYISVVASTMLALLSIARIGTKVRGR